MIYRDPKCVFVADSMGLAEVVAVWLHGQDIPAEVMNRATLGGLLGLTFWAPTGMISASGLEVWVVDPDHAERARQLLAEHAEQLAARSAAAAGDPEQIEVRCDECGGRSIFPGKDRGTVQSCSHCNAYLDVPGPEENWDESECDGAGEGE